LTQSFDKFSVKVGFDITALEQAIGRKFKTPDDVSQGIVEARKRAAEIEQQLSQSNIAGRAVADLKNQLGEIDKVIARVENSLRADNSNVGEGFRAFLTDFRAVSAASEITQADLQRLFDELNSVQESAQGFFGIGKRPFLLGDLENIVKALPLLKQLQEQRSKAIEVAPTTLEELNRIKAVIDSIQPTSFQSAATAINQSAASAERLAAAYREAVTAANQINAQLQRPAVSAQAPRSVEATPLPTQSTSTTVNLGGITVNATPGTNGDLVGRQIAAALNRELRRNATALRV
jgi:hypothetical protein